MGKLCSLVSALVRAHSLRLWSTTHESVRIGSAPFVNLCCIVAVAISITRGCDYEAIGVFFLARCSLLLPTWTRARVILLSRIERESAAKTPRTPVDRTQRRTFRRRASDSNSFNSRSTGPQFRGAERAQTRDTRL